jgi:hypothetical protein
MHSRHRWLIHRDVAGTVDLLLRGQAARPQIRELGADGQLQLRDPLPPAIPPSILTSSKRAFPSPSLAPVPLPDPAAPTPHRQADQPGQPFLATAPSPPPLRLYGAGLSSRVLEAAARSRQLPVRVVETVEQADAVLSLRGHLGREPELRRSAQALGLPILVIKSDNLHQLERAMERLLERRHAGDGELPPAEDASAAPPRLDDAHAAMEECRLAVEQVVLPQGRPVELLPRSERVRQMQAELVSRYRLRSAVFGRGLQQRLRVFPA